MPYLSINPFAHEVLANYDTVSYQSTFSHLHEAKNAQIVWKDVPNLQKAQLLTKVAEILEANVDKYALLITNEMGKLLKESKAEIMKCAACLRYYAENGADFLAHKPVKNAASVSMVTFEPLGVILAIMPWNFPFWQAIRFLAPTLMAGNGVILKHASNVPQCAEALVHIFLEAGFPKGLFQNLFIDSSEIPLLIAHPVIKAVTITGSEAAGRSVAEAAGKNLKKLVLELGGSDPFIVTEDVNIAEVAQKAVTARMINNGQSCVAAKRFIVHESIFMAFIEAVKKIVMNMKFGDPLLEDTDYSILSRPDLVIELHKQVTASVKMGCEVIIGGEILRNQEEAYTPTIINVNNYEAPVWSEETFGPVMAITSYAHDEDAIKLANESLLGLGASVWCNDKDRALNLASQVESGSVFINEIMKSDPSVPFGGIKNSGYGRELSAYGMHEFVNIKTIWVK